eukprot:TRINITY_DN31041_c0_g1_i1.p1 TRINITY_DN31041_c0_g1~~TRINITY_DN31041_c0_g1_i1.p1  ORF type:complete len:257 (+),score=42.35 TRINITY_DN31041_c0_g1_i1:73-843(+)
MSAWRLDGKVALVTGGTKGIGAAIVAELLALGASVVTCARSLPSTAKQLRGAVYVTADVSTSEGREAVLGECVRRHGRLDVLVNNVGTNVRKAATEMTDEEYDSVMRTNLSSAFHLSRASFPHLKRSQGAVVNVSSVSGSQSDGTGVAYHISKAGMEHMTRYLAVEWGRDGVRVNAVAPWFVRTELTAPILKGQLLRDVQHRTPMGRVGEADEVARAAIFLALPASGYVTGAVVPVDGGLLSQCFSSDALSTRPRL